MSAESLLGGGVRNKSEGEIRGEEGENHLGPILIKT